MSEFDIESFLKEENEEEIIVEEGGVINDSLDDDIEDLSIQVFIFGFLLIFSLDYLLPLTFSCIFCGFDKERRIIFMSDGRGG